MAASSTEGSRCFPLRGIASILSGFSRYQSARAVIALPVRRLTINTPPIKLILEHSPSVLSFYCAFSTFRHTRPHKSAVASSESLRCLPCIIFCLLIRQSSPQPVHNIFTFSSQYLEENSGRTGSGCAVKPTSYPYSASVFQDQTRGGDCKIHNLIKLFFRTAGTFLNVDSLTLNLTMIMASTKLWERINQFCSIVGNLSF